MVDNKDKESCGDCGCGCGDDDLLEFGDEHDIMYLTLDDDTELECNVLGIFEVEDKEYIALVPVDEEEALIYEYVELENDDFDLLSIEDEEEFDLISQAFYALFTDDEDMAEYGTYDDLEEDEE